MMLVLLLCIIMKIADISTRHINFMSTPCQQLPYYKKKRNDDKGNQMNKHLNEKRINKGGTTMEEPHTPCSDCNSNPATDPNLQDLVSSEFIQDNSEYQWFIDYKDGGLQVHTSILSSLSASYTQDDLGYYDDLSRNLDANLAEVDMESFRTSDIHTLLTTLPAVYTNPVQRSEGEDSACSTTDTISICKSSLLFSPVKEIPVLLPGGSYSVDSLDCEDMLLTCQTNNKNNYTIAFEGSIAMYSDGSQDFEGQEKQKKSLTQENDYEKTLDMNSMFDLSMPCSNSKIYITWSNLKHSSINKTISRHPSGNNNTIPNFLQGTDNFSFNSYKKSQSLPDLSKSRNLLNVPLKFSIDSADSGNHIIHLQSAGDIASRSVNDSSSDSMGNGSKRIHNMSLVKLFMKQKSISVEGMSLTLDQSDSVSDEWPTGTSCSDSGTNTQIVNKQNINYLGNDFSINWLKTDDNRNVDSDSLDNAQKYSYPRSLNNKHSDEIMTSSISIEEFTEEVSRSMSDTSNFQTRSRKSEKVTPSFKTTGTQVITEVEENGVQTSLIYPEIQDSKNNSKSTSNELFNKQPIYVVYPNYALPDLSFLNVKKEKYENVTLKPQNYSKQNIRWKDNGKAERPFSCNDIDALKQKGFDHVKDWESLTFLLPNEYRKILKDVPEFSKHIRTGDDMKKPLFCLSPPMRYRRRTFSEYVPNNISSSSSTATQPSSGYRGSSTILTDSSCTNQQITSNNNAINPLYLYRYDSISSEASITSQDKNAVRQPYPDTRNCYGYSKHCTPLMQTENVPLDYYNNKAPPRPPLPRSILRKNKVSHGKRCSMFEVGNIEMKEQRFEINKRMSLEEPYYMNNDHQIKHNRDDDSDKDVDETEENNRAEKYVELASQAADENEVLQTNEEDIKQLEEFLKRSGFSSSSDGDDENSDIKLRSCVRKFLNLKMNKDIFKNMDMIDSQKKTVSFAVQKNYNHDTNKVRVADQNKERVNVAESSENTPINSLEVDDKKREMIWSVTKAVNILLKYWHAEPIYNRQGYNENNECAQLCINNLCPALYTIMSDGLKPCLDSTFGPIANSVWQVVEASSQQGPLTKTLNDLVQKINAEDCITEGMLKFHAFVFGLLNLRALDAWFAYLCTRESILRKHYNNNSLFVGSFACINSREIVDALLETLQPLALCPFQLDLLYQYRQLHHSFGNVSNHNANFRTIESPKKERNETRINCLSPRKIRPRSSYIPIVHEKQEIDSITKKRWSSNLPLTTRMFNALEKHGSDDSEDYADSLEHSPLNKGCIKQNGTKPSRNTENKISINENDMIPSDIKFRRLQEKLELIGKEDAKELNLLPSPSSPNRIISNISKSKIPRPLTSPVKQSSVLSPAQKNIKSTSSGIPSLRKAINTQTTKVPDKKTDLSRNIKDTTPRRTSRVDQDNIFSTKTHVTRPSSLPYKTFGTSTKDKNTESQHRRAASTSLPRPNSALTPRSIPVKQPQKFAHTLTHRLPSSEGHLSFNEGDKLKVILEVDNKWLLCARGKRKGLVPRSSVHLIQT